MAAGTGGNIATVFQIEDPVNPTTVDTPSFAAARAVSFISSAARCRTPSGEPSPQTRSGRIPRCRSSMGSSQTACPTRWVEIANTRRSCLARSARRPSTYDGWASARSTSKWSPQQAISSPSYPLSAASRHTSSNGRSAHWPVNRVTGRGIGHPELSGAEDVLERELVEPLVVHAAGTGDLRVEVHIGLDQPLPALAGVQRGLGERGHPGRLQRGRHLRIGPERGRPLLQQQIGLHAPGGGRPHTGEVLGPRRLEVEVPGSGVDRAGAAGALEQVDGEERALQVAGAEPQVLVVLDAVLAVEVDVEQLAGPQRLGDALGVVEPGHLLVPDLRVHADHLGVLEPVDERQRVPDGRQEDVPARLVGLRLQREPDVVALVQHVPAEQVEGLLEPVIRGVEVLAGVGLGALPAAPGHVDLRAELRGEIDVAQHLADREPAHVPVVRGERAVLEHRVGEQVRRHHRDGQAGLRERVLEPGDQLGPVGLGRAERDQVVVVERHPGRAELGQPVHGLHRVERRSGRVAERVAAEPADRPQPESEPVFLGRNWGESRHGSSTSVQQPRSAAERCTASRTSCTCSPSSNDGSGSVPAPTARTRSAISCTNVSPQPSVCPGGYQPDRYGWPGSVTTTRRKPCSSASSVPSRNSSSLSRSRSNARLPVEPFTSTRIAFFLPVANRVASYVAIAPPSSRPRNSAASSTVTSASSPPAAVADRPAAAPGSGRRRTNVSSSALTPVNRCPVTNWVRSTMCAPMSPSAPLPASSARSRQTSGNSGSTIQSCRYCARTWRTVPIRPAATSARANATAGTRR